MYYMLECLPPLEWEDNALVKTPQTRLVPRGESWSMGRRFSVDPVEPIEFEMMETHNDQMLELRKSDPMLMTKKLLAAFHNAGVDNLDTYQTIIRHPTTGFETDDYVAVNIIGLVSVADMSKSNKVNGSEYDLFDVDFDGLSIDKNKAKGLLMFRLAESTNGVVVHESVKKSLLEQGFDMLEFMEPEEWVG